MAAKSAMKKDPTVSIAIPKSEKDRLKDVGTRQPGKPQPMDDKGNINRPQNLQRLSPGVYRNSRGQLTNSSGRVMERRQPQGGSMVDALAQQGGVQAAPLGTLPSQESIDAGRRAADLARNPQAYERFQLGQNQQNGNAMPTNGNIPIYGNSKPLTPQERLERGIDPRDPNQYFMTEDGRVMGTLIGWNPNPQQSGIQNLLNRQPPQMEQPQQPNTISGLLRNRFR